MQTKYIVGHACKLKGKNWKDAQTNVNNNLFFNLIYIFPSKPEGKKKEQRMYDIKNMIKMAIVNINQSNKIQL